jgi:hypothetical protein
MQTLATTIRAVIIAALLAMGAGSVTALASDHPGECGEFKYWHHGKCEDARMKPGKPWTASVF